MRAKVIKRFFDRTLDDYREVDQEFEVDQERLEVLTYAGVVKQIEEPQAEEPKTGTKKTAK